MWRWLWIGLGAAACKPVPEVRYEPGPEVTLISVVALVDGALRGATPWTPTDQPLSFLIDDEARHLVVGLDGASIGDPDLQASLRGERPIEARGCDPSLPTPTFVGELIDGRVSSTELVPPRLSTAGWQVRCPPQTPELRIDAPTFCLSQACRPVLSPNGACRYQVDLSGCGLGKPELRVDPRGQICVGLDSERFACEARGSGQTCLDGPSCPIHLDPFTPEEPPPFDRAVVTVGPPEEGTFSNYVNSSRYFQRGNIRDLVRIGDRVVVVRNPEIQPGSACEHERPPNVLYLFNADTLSLTGTVAAERCLNHLAQHAAEILGVYYDRGWFLGRFDEAGQKLGQVPLDADEFPPSQYDVVDLVPFPEGGRLAVVFGASENSAEDGGVLVLELGSFRLLHNLRLPARLRPAFAHRAGNTELAISAAEQQRVAWIDLGTGTVAQEVVVRNEFLPDATLMSSLVLGDRIYTPGHENLYEVDRSGMVERRLFHDPEQLLFALSPWPKDPTRVLVVAVGAVALSGLRPSSGVWFDTRTDRFEPGRWHLADRPVSAIEVDEQQRVWLLIREQAELVRLTPR
jgi:hypothetical protein